MKKITTLISAFVAISFSSFAQQQINTTPANDNMKQEKQRQESRIPTLNDKSDPSPVKAIQPATQQLGYNKNATLLKTNNQLLVVKKKPVGMPLDKQVSPTGLYVPQKIAPAVTPAK